MTSFAQLLGVGFVLTIIQAIAAIPWLVVLYLDAFRTQRREPQPGFWLRYLGGAAGVLVGVAILMALLMRSVQLKDTLGVYGRLYGTALHVQIAVDFFVLTFAILMLVWPKGAAVALAAFR